MTLDAPDHLCRLASVPVAAVLAAASMTTPSLCGRAVETDGSSEQGRDCQSVKGGLNTSLECGVWIKGTRYVGPISEVKMEQSQIYSLSGSS